MTKPVPHFINTDDQIFGSSAVNIFRKFGEMLSYYYYWNFPRRMLLSKFLTMYCTCAIKPQSSWH